ncbi:hypothetical protein ACFRR6_38260 [Streptomyces sp. NPDC056891]|uniref:hypothetical protein n=1 Tax=Streptomyces sp. NPDC056891 TaxID=3345961 RepID=UPI00367A9AD3
MAVADLADGLLALGDRPPFVRTVLEGDLGPADQPGRVPTRRGSRSGPSSISAAAYASRVRLR